MTEIHKYPLEGWNKGPVTIQTSTFSHRSPLLVAEQNGVPCIWLQEPEPENKTRTRTFQVFGTGYELPVHSLWLGSWQSPPFVWHLYDVTD